MSQLWKLDCIFKNLDVAIRRVTLSMVALAFELWKTGLLTVLYSAKKVLICSVQVFQRIF